MVSELDHQEIALWGPTSSGKTWLAKSLGKILYRLSARDEDFKYELSDPSGNVLNVLEPPPREATEGIYDTLYNFRRIPKENTPNHFLSAHRHSINVHDHMGARTVELAENHATLVSIRDSDYVLMMLDPTLLTTFQGSYTIAEVTPSSSENDELMSLLDSPGNDEDDVQLSELSYEQHEYAAKVQQLLAQLASTTRRINIAICITKIDVLSVQMREPWKLIDMYFGEDMYHMLDTYRGQFNVEAFAVSSAGFLPGRKPNFDPGTGKILNPNEWEPYNVEAPFFWLFDIIERERIENSNRGLSKFLFQGDRRAKYIPYKIRRL